MHPMTLTQKILAAHARNLPRPWVQAGDVLQVQVDWTIASELAWNGMDRTYAALGRPKLHNKEKFFLAVDHTVDPTTLQHDPRTQKLVQLSQSFAKESGIKHFYDSNQTILHTKFYRDLVRPGDVVLGADSHSSSHGGLGAFSIGLGGADIVVAMVLGATWLEVPEAIAVEFTGALPFGLSGKDVILRTLGLLGRNTVAMERSVEYRGAGVRQLSTDARFAIANMTAEFGGLNGIFEADEVTAAWLAGRADDDDALALAPLRTFRADEGAPYAAHYPVDLSDLEPQVALPFSPDKVVGVTKAAGTGLQGLFIGACTTTEEELVMGALVLEAQEKLQGRQSSRAGTDKQLVVPGDLTIEENLRRAGLWELYARAGFRVDPPGCSMCLGVASRKALSGEKWLSSQNRNFENRMGDGSLAHLSSAATVAASAARMQITDPRPLLAMVDQDKYRRILGERRPRRAPELQLVQPALHLSTQGATQPGLQAVTAAEFDRVKAETAAAKARTAAQAVVVRSRVQRFGDNVDTDAIIPGAFCHLTRLEDLGAKAFAVVRPDFPAKAAAGARIVVAGEGWGSGSSREQAVLALKGAGIECVIAKSYAFIHKRNLVNEAVPFLLVKDPAFYEAASEGVEVEVDLAAGQARVAGAVFHAAKPRKISRALNDEGGIVPAIQRNGVGVFEKLVR